MRPKLKGWDIQLSETHKNEADGQLTKTYIFRCEKNNDDYHTLWIPVTVNKKQLEFLDYEGEAHEKSLVKLQTAIVKEIAATEELI